MTHPIVVRRVKELMEWVQSGEYDRIVDGSFPRRGHEPPPTTEFDATVAHLTERFSRFPDRTAGSVQDLAKQLSDWLKKSPAGGRGGRLTLASGRGATYGPRRAGAAGQDG